MKLSDYKEELIEETKLAYEIDEKLHDKGQLFGLIEIERKCLKLAAMVMQTHQSIVDHMEEMEQPPRAKGRWYHLGGDEWCCSNCGHVISTEGSWEKPDAKFCENCGADMRESEE